MMCRVKGIVSFRLLQDLSKKDPGKRPVAGRFLASSSNNAENSGSPHYSSRTQSAMLSGTCKSNLGRNTVSTWNIRGEVSFFLRGLL